MFDLDALIESEGGLYQTMFPDGTVFVWRLLTLREYRAFASLRAGGVLLPWMLHTRVFERCYVGDASLINGHVPAGYEISLGQLILWLSGDCVGATQKDDIEMARMQYQADSVEEVMKRVVLLAFPSYTLEDIQSWTRPELLRKFVVAESVLVSRGLGYEPLDTRKIMSPGEAAQKQNQIDFAKDNREMARSMSTERESVLDLPPDEFAKRQKIAQSMEQRGFRTNRRG